ncbi:hypothetical protein GN958_ATG12694 [Phytophthora infestans]|uniref:Uncharacterized protein n=1 Tax=Phytophthora infestans TaxID=4787 RepID=A0A8S9UAF1_PHYIN|nr:hypothetical protein GN958_ATG12694 [Phytophthora infestans]
MKGCAFVPSVRRRKTAFYTTKDRVLYDDEPHATTGGAAHPVSPATRDRLPPATRRLMLHTTGRRSAYGGLCATRRHPQNEEHPHDGGLYATRIRARCCYALVHMTDA